MLDDSPHLSYSLPLFRNTLLPFLTEILLALIKILAQQYSCYDRDQGCPYFEIHCHSCPKEEERYKGERKSKELTRRGREER
jgi:hypothetical protein